MNGDSVTGVVMELVPIAVVAVTVLTAAPSPLLLPYTLLPCPLLQLDLVLVAMVAVGVLNGWCCTITGGAGDDNDDDNEDTDV